MSNGSTKELCAWLREHSSGAYRRSSEAAAIIEQLERQNARLRASLEAARPVADAGEAVLWIDPKSNSDWRNEQPLHGETKMVMLTGATDKFGEWSVPLYRAAPSARTLSDAEILHIFNEQPDSISTIGFARAILAAASAPAEAPSVRTWQERNERGESIEGAMLAEIADWRALQGKPEAAKGGDTALLDWLNEQPVDTIYLDDGTLIDVRGCDIRKAIEKAKVAAPKLGEQEGGK